jgi:hypothetical protein
LKKLKRKEEECPVDFELIILLLRENKVQLDLARAHWHMIVKNVTI